MDLEKCKPGIWIEIYDGNLVKIIEVKELSIPTQSEKFEIYFDSGGTFMDYVSNENIVKILDQDAYPELYL